MHITQGTFSYLPPLTDGEIGAQVQYGIDRAWMVSIEFTDDPHPRNVYWHLWGMPMFDLLDAAAVLSELNRCREAVGSQYVRLSLYDPSLGRQTTALQFMVHRPAKEPGYRLDRAYAGAREVRYTMHPYASDRPHGSRYP